MITSAVFLVQDASTNSITTLHDRLATEIPKMLGRWSFELKIFKANNQSAPQRDNSDGFLYDLAVDYDPTKSVTLVNKTAIVTTTDVPGSLAQAGCSNGSPDTLGQILQLKLQSLWTLRQVLKGDNGNGYELRGGEFVIRAINVFLHGNFKNFIVLIEHHSNSKSNKTRELSIQKIESLVEELELPKGRLCTDTLSDGADYLSNVIAQLVQAFQT
ncbi:CYFA0S16e02476g1_1 [Cyberlindnera fabianii]|uniref:Mediator of RNA polymerase II transcription subunit 20 n=1 Tax=Cyberlindnera fabianii TaxID=36022 RepID=A0A061BB77_CYBFA|nr:CYFA0S16e02476g1_1 [Cyberlindnera fabianii]